jgi:hypothetical protein
VRAWFAFLVQGRALALALALGLGSAAASLADQLSKLAVGVLTEHAGRYPGEDDTVLGLLDLFSAPYFLYFTVGGTVVVYGYVLLCRARARPPRRSRRVDRSTSGPAARALPVVHGEDSV